MSKQNPSASGRNNMNLSLWFTYRGHAIHLGNPNRASHGCVHVGRKGAQALFDWANTETKIVITRERYLPFVRRDLAEMGYKASDAPKRIQKYLKENPLVKPKIPKVETGATTTPTSSNKDPRDMF